MDAIFMNSKNSKTPDAHILLLNLSEKMNLKRSHKYVALSNLNMLYIWKNIKKFMQKQYIQSISSNVQ